MTTLETKTTMVELLQQDTPFDEAQLAAAALLARYSGRTLDAYRHDLRMFFQWASDTGPEVLKAAGPTSSSTAARWRPEVWPLPRSTGGCPRCAGSTAFDRHAAYVVVAFVAGG